MMIKAFKALQNALEEVNVVLFVSSCSMDRRSYLSSTKFRLLITASTSYMAGGRILWTLQWNHQLMLDLILFHLSILLCCLYSGEPHFNFLLNRLPSHAHAFNVTSGRTVIAGNTLVRGIAAPRADNAQRVPHERRAHTEIYAIIKRWWSEIQIKIYPNLHPSSKDCPINQPPGKASSGLSNNMPNNVVRGC